MKLLAIDTATEGCSAALIQDGELITRIEVVPRKHAELILPMIDELLAEVQLRLNQLDALAFGRGPGAFTGVRIATGVIQGIAFGTDLPVVPVSTLVALAQRAYREHAAEHDMAAFDARMDEIYWASCELDENRLMQLSTEEMVIKPAQLKDSTFPDKQWTAAGSGWQAYQDELLAVLNRQPSVILPGLITRAEEIALLAVADFEKGLAVSAEQALPVYLRNEVAWKKQS